MGWKRKYGGEEISRQNEERLGEEEKKGEERRELPIDLLVCY